MSDLPPLDLLDAALRGALLALLSLLGLRLSRGPSPPARFGAALALGLGLQVLGSTPLLEARLPWAWQAPLVAVSVANAVLFWLFVRALFDDEFRPRPLHGLAWLAAAALGGLNCTIAGSGVSALAIAASALQRAVPLLCSVLAAWAATRQWRADLVEGRRRLRGFIVVTGIAYTLVMLAVRLGSSRGRLSAAMATVDAALLLAIVAVVAARLLRLGDTALFPVPPALPAAGPAVAATGLAPAEVGVPGTAADGPAAHRPDPAEDRLAERLQRVMADEQAYRSADLTIASLAARLAVPEYRLRRLINRRLGHRNFNAFVNGYRLDEARAVLADPARRELSILALALDAGFQSIGPFNRAFKAATGLTPSESRRARLADS